jgi:light-regulated signal transduction histidine kinase (bacteriophytochrome)
LQKPDHTELLRDLHHAVNSPLSSIFNLTEMLLLGIEGEMSAEVRQDVQTIADDAQRLHRASEGLLEFIGMVTADRPVQPIDVGELLNVIGNGLDLSLTVQLPTITQPLLMLGNKDALRLIFQKLITSLMRGDQSTTLTIDVHPDDDLILFSISRDEIREATHDKRDFASSLDLLLCEHLLRLQGGALWFDTSAPTQKTLCFSLQKSK